MDFARMFEKATPLILSGFWLTIRISIVALCLGMILGLITCLFRLSKLRVMKFLEENNLIRRVGSKKTGYWEIVANAFDSQSDSQNDTQRK